MVRSLAIQPTTKCLLLQWSHVFSDMVSSTIRFMLHQPLLASMEPCLFRHGKIRQAWRGAQYRRASMEPCLFRHGKLVVCRFCRASGPASMEPCLFRHGKSISRCLSTGRSATGLQWSHVFSDMVSPEEPALGGDLTLASMEPCLFRHGKLSSNNNDPESPPCFNGAMSFQTW